MKMPTRTTSAVDHKRCGVVVRLARRKAGLSLRQVSSRLGVSVAYLSALELGKRNWTQDLFGRALNAISPVSDD